MFQGLRQIICIRYHFVIERNLSVYKVHTMPGEWFYSVFHMQDFLKNENTN